MKSKTGSRNSWWNNSSTAVPPSIVLIALLWSCFYFGNGITTNAVTWSIDLKRSGFEFDFGFDEKQQQPIE